MRPLTSLLVTLVCMLGFVATSQAAVTVDFLSGGQSNVYVSTSSTITVDIYVTVTGSENLTGFGFSVLGNGVEVGGGMA